MDVYGLPEDHFDSPCGEGTGAAVIFGTTGGVMEAALRSCYYLATGQNPDPDDIPRCPRHGRAWKEAAIDINGTEVKVAVVSGLRQRKRVNSKPFAAEV
ncbi:MAG: [Fe-Fe] hydrogenase large subunit C-terminal domain-containing protein [Anaerobutyricum soehngenii]